MKTATYYKYVTLLADAGPRLKELILSRAAQEKDLSLEDLVSLCRVAYPEEV